MNRTTWILLPVIATLGATTGCKDDENNRIADLAAAHLAAQAEQSERTHELQHEVAKGTTKLIEADRQSREQLVTLQADLQDQRREVDRQRDLLEAERQRVDTARNFDSLTAIAVDNAVLMLACLLPVALAWLVLNRPDDSPGDGVIVEAMLDDLTSDRPSLFASRLAGLPNEETQRKRICHQASPTEPDHDKHSDGDEPCPTS